LKNMIEMILNYWKIARHPNPALTWTDALAEALLVVSFI
jgi:hypothetical protein